MLRESMYLVIGALLAGLIGYLSTRIYESQKSAAARRALASMLHAELMYEAPFDDPIYHDPKEAKRIQVRSISQLLSPGILDPAHHAFLITNLVFLASSIDDFNERARLFDEAILRDASPAQLQLLYNSLQMSNRDYNDAHRLVLAELWMVGPPFPFSNIYNPKSLKDRFWYWRIRKQRHLWLEHTAVAPPIVEE
jgi:hypothetical protein